MSDWDFLHEMHDRGYSAEEIAAAAGSGAAPWEWVHIAKQEVDAEWQELKKLHDGGRITQEEFKQCKEDLFS